MFAVLVLKNAWNSSRKIVRVCFNIENLNSKDEEPLRMTEGRV